MLLQISEHHFGETLNFTMKCKLFAVAAVDETADQDLKGWGYFSQCQAQKHTARATTSLGFTASELLWFHGHPMESKKQQASSQRSDVIPGEPSVICFLLRVTPEMPLNAPASPDPRSFTARQKATSFTASGDSQRKAKSAHPMALQD